MRKFDPIDIFFISLISAYFITLFCIGITFLYIKLTKDKKTKVSKEVKVDIGSVKNKKKISKSMVKKDFDFDFEAFKKKIISLPLIRTLFMKKVNPKKEYAEELKSIKLEVKPNEIPNETTIEESSLIQEKQQEGKTKSAKLEESNKIKTNKSENNKSKKVLILLKKLIL